MGLAPPSLDTVSAALRAYGLILRGGLVFAAGEAAPDGPLGGPARCVLLVGQAGASVWPHFSRWREDQAKDPANPLDSWSREVIGDIARRFGARAVSPSDRPYQPFQQWAMRAEGLKPSPLGILMHPQYGLWHAYRGALLFGAELSIPQPAAQLHLCDLCIGKPCLSACPADAYSAKGFAHGACIGHLSSGRGGECMSAGCLARNACPHGKAYRYPAEIQAYHQAHFVRS